MQLKRKNNARETGISTASLPDIVFMLLFFFMVTTVMVEQTPVVDAKLPQITSVDELKNRSLIEYLYVGPLPGEPIENAHIQYKDQLLNTAQFGAVIDSAIKTHPVNDQGKITVSLTIHEDTKMKMVNEIKTELRKKNRLKVLYKTAPVATVQ